MSIFKRLTCEAISNKHKSKYTKHHGIKKDEKTLSKTPSFNFKLKFCYP